MTTYIGVVTLSATGKDSQGDHFGVTLTATVTSQMTLESGGTVDENISLVGTYAYTVQYSGGRVSSGSNPVNYKNISGVTNLSNFNAILGPINAEAGVAVTVTDSVNANRSEISLSGSGTFDKPMQIYRYGVATSTTFIGTASVSGSIAASYPEFGFAAADLDITQGAPNTVTPISFEVARSGDTSGAVSTTWSLVGSGPDPVAPADFSGGVLPSGTVSFAAGQSVAQVTVDVLGAPHSDSAETFAVDVSPVSIGDLIIATGTLSANGIIDGNPACFAAGTGIATPEGDVRVEQLVIGSLVCLAGGGTRPVVWLGHRRLDCARHPRPSDVRPVRILAGAFAPGCPARDLRLSPDHAVAVGGALIPVRYLLNGATVVQEAAGEVGYWHVELDRHAVLLADGLPCESYLDTGNRAAFGNGGAAVALHPDFARGVWQTAACAPLVLSGPEVAGQRRRLLARARELGFTATADARLCVLADGRRVALRGNGRRWRAALPPGTGCVQLISRTWVPAQMRPDDRDTRVLGVAIAGLWIDGRKRDLDSSCLGAGWHKPEPAWRWTSGAGGIAAAGGRSLWIDVAMTGSYWLERRRAAVVAQ